MIKEIKIHYNPYANDFPVDKRLPKTICGQKNNGNETHIKDEVTCLVCKRTFKNVDKLMNGGLQEILDNEKRIKSMTFEEFENYERLNSSNQSDFYNKTNRVNKFYYKVDGKIVAYTEDHKFLGECIPGKRKYKPKIKSINEFNEYIFQFGKYIGKNIKEVEDVEYLKWVVNLNDLSMKDRKFIINELKSRGIKLPYNPYI